MRHFCWHFVIKFILIYGFFYLTGLFNSLGTCLPNADLFGDPCSRSLISSQRQEPINYRYACFSWIFIATSCDWWMEFLKCSIYFPTDYQNFLVVGIGNCNHWGNLEIPFGPPPGPFSTSTSSQQKACAFTATALPPSISKANLDWHEHVEKVWT